MASLRGFRCVGIALIAVLSCLSAGCSEDTRVQVEDPSVFACQEAKMFVKALDYIVNNSKAERTKEAYETLGTILHDDSRKDEFGPMPMHLDHWRHFREKSKCSLNRRLQNLKTLVRKWTK